MNKDLSDRIKAAKSSHDLHVLAVMRAHKCSKSAALIVAYVDGPLALEHRLAEAAKPTETAKPEAAK